MPVMVLRRALVCGRDAQPFGLCSFHIQAPQAGQDVHEKQYGAGRHACSDGAHQTHAGCVCQEGYEDTCFGLDALGERDFCCDLLDQGLWCVLENVPVLRCLGVVQGRA